MASPFDRAWTRQPPVITGLSAVGKAANPSFVWSAADDRDIVTGTRPSYGSGITKGLVGDAIALTFSGTQSGSDTWFGQRNEWNGAASFWALAVCSVPTGVGETSYPLSQWNASDADTSHLFAIDQAGTIVLALRPNSSGTYAVYSTSAGVAPTGKQITVGVKWVSGSTAVVYLNGTAYSTTRTGTAASDTFVINSAMTTGKMQIGCYLGGGVKGSVALSVAGVTPPPNLQELSKAPWQLFAPLRRPIFPGFAAGGGVNLTPGNTSIAVASFAPTLAQTTNSALTPGAATIAVSAFAPTIARTANVALTPGVTTLSIAAFAPASAQTANIALTPGVVGLTVATFAPTMAQSSASTFTPAAAALSLAAFAPTLAQTSNSSLIPSAAALTISTFAPTLTVGAGINLTPGQAALTLASFAPTIAQSANVALTPAAAAITVQTYAPNLAQSGALNLTPGTAALVLQIFVPSLVQSSDEVFAAITSGRMLRSAPSGGRAPQVSTSRRPS